MAARQLRQFKNTMYLSSDFAEGNSTDLIFENYFKGAPQIFSDFEAGLRELGHNDATIISFVSTYVPVMELLSRIGELMQANHLQTEA